MSYDIPIAKDGTVRFADDYPEHHREAVIRLLANQGHTLKTVTDERGKATRHMQIQNWVPPDESKPA